MLFILPKIKMPAMEIAGLCLPLKPQKERISNKLSDYK